MIILDKKNCKSIKNDLVILNKDLTFSASTSLLVGKLPSYKRFSNRYISLIKFTIPRLSYKPDSSYLYLYIEN